MNFPFPDKRRGVSLTELMVYVAVLSIAVALFSRFMTGFMRSAKGAENSMLGSAEIRRALSVMEGDLYEANEFIGVSRTSVTFVCDIVRAPGYAMDADRDGDGVPNIKDTDTDDDAQLKFSLPRDQQWRAGYNLEDDDEDGDGQPDMRVQIYYSSSAVYRAASVNGGAWQAESLAARVSSFTFTFYGSKREDLGKNIDLGRDGAAGTGDSGEGDGVISEREIDWVQPPVGHGNRSGAIDTADERKYVTSVGVYIEADHNGDGKADAWLATEIAPPLAPLKRRR